MFSRDSDKPTKTSSSSSVIGTEMQINGNIKCNGALLLKGKVKGNIEWIILTIEFVTHPLLSSLGMKFRKLYVINCKPQKAW